MPVEESRPDEQLETRLHEAGDRTLEANAQKHENQQAENPTQEVTAGEAAKKVAEAARAVASYVKGLCRNGWRIVAEQAGF